jgi:hypothetical protein
LSLKNPLAYYTPGIPGRGAGTILKQPDLTGYAARQMKLTDLKLKQKQDHDAAKIKTLNELQDLKGVWWEKNNVEISKMMEDFEKEAATIWAKSNGNPDVQSLSKLNSKKLAVENAMAQSKKQETRYYSQLDKIFAAGITGNYSFEDIDLARNNVVAWGNMNISDRENNPVEIYMPKEFDYNKFKGEIQTKGIAGKTKVASNDITIPINGKDVIKTINYDVYTTKDAATDLWSAYVNGTSRQKNAMEVRYDMWKVANPNETNSYTDYDVDINSKKAYVVERKNIPITSFKDWVEKVEAPTITKYGESKNLSGSGGGGGNVSVNVSGSGVPQKTNIAASAPVSMPYGNVTVYGQKVDANKVIDEKSQLTFTPSKEAYTVEGDTPSAGIVQGGSAMIYPIAAKDIKWSTGAVSKKGTILARPEYWSEVDYNSWMDKNKNLYSYSPYILLYNTSAKNTTVDKFSKQESFIKANLGDDYWNEVWRITNEMNVGSTPAPQQQNNNTGGSKFKGLPKNGKF